MLPNLSLLSLHDTADETEVGKVNKKKEKKKEAEAKGTAPRPYVYRKEDLDLAKKKAMPGSSSSDPVPARQRVGIQEADLTFQEAFKQRCLDVATFARLNELGPNGKQAVTAGNRVAADAMRLWMGLSGAPTTMYQLANDRPTQVVYVQQPGDAEPRRDRRRWSDVASQEQRDRYFSGMMEAAAYSLAFAATGDNAFDPDLAGRQVHQTNFNMSTVERPEEFGKDPSDTSLNTKYTFNATEVQSIYFELMKEHSASLAVGKTEFITSVPNNEMLSKLGRFVVLSGADGKETNAKYLLNHVECTVDEVDLGKKLEFDRSMYNLWTFGGAVDDSRGHSVYPYKYGDFTHHSMYYLTDSFDQERFADPETLKPEDRDRTTGERANYVTPNDSLAEMYTLTEAYFNRTGKLIHLEEVHEKVKAVPRLSRRAIFEAAKACASKYDYFTLTEWRDFLPHVAVQLCPNFFQIWGLLQGGPYQSRSRFIPQFALLPNSYIPAWAKTQVYTKMKIKTVYNRMNTNPSVLRQPGPVIVDSTVYLYPPTPIKTWLAALFQMHRADELRYKKYELVIPFPKQGQQFVMHYNVVPGNTNTINLILPYEDGYVPGSSEFSKCADISLDNNRIHIDLLFYRINSLNSCRIGWPKEIGKGYGDAVIETMFQAAAYNNRFVDLDDASYIPHGSSRPFLISTGSHGLLMYGGWLTYTQMMLRGFGYYEARGFWPRQLQGYDRLDQQMYAEERLDWQHMVCTSQLQALQTNMIAYSKDAANAARFPHPADFEMGCKDAIQSAKELLDMFLADYKTDVASYEAINISPQMSIRAFARNVQDGKIPAQDARVQMVINVLRTYFRETVSRTDDGSHFEWNNPNNYPGHELSCDFWPVGLNNAPVHYSVVNTVDESGAIDYFAVPRLELTVVPDLETYDISVRATAPPGGGPPIPTPMALP